VVLGRQITTPAMHRRFRAIQARTRCQVSRCLLAMP
jgi:hypothetical protein